MLKRLAAATLAALATAGAFAGNSIVTASERGTYIEIGRDLSRLVAQPAGIALDVLPSAGSAENVRRLRSEPGVRLALMQSDVYRAFLDQARAGDAEADRLVKPLRVVLPLYDEEIYFVVRADSPLQHLDDIRDKRINVGPVGSGSALTATTVYRTMFDAPPPDGNLSFLSNEEALVKLTTDKSIDVVVVVAGQPARLFSGMTAQARNFVKLLSVDPAAPSTQALHAVYSDATVHAASYANWLSQDVPSIAVKSVLATYDYQSPAVRDTLVRFAHSMCTNFSRLKADGHAKWNEVELAQPALTKGWTYYAPTQRVLSHCNDPAPAPVAGATAAAAPAPSADCTQNRALLGLCRPAKP